MASNLFIGAEAVMAFCGLAIVALTLLNWDGDSIQVAGLIFAALMFAAGLVAAIGGMRQRQQLPRASDAQQ